MQERSKGGVATAERCESGGGRLHDIKEAEMPPTTPTAEAELSVNRAGSVGTED
jgi:hypothetical protein